MNQFDDNVNKRRMERAMDMDIPKDKFFAPGDAQCGECGGHGCKVCDKRGWVEPTHPRARRCFRDGCGKIIPPAQVAVYCSNECAFADADAPSKLELIRFVTAPDEVDLSEISLPIWTVYDHPRDFPHKFIVRLFDGRAGAATNVALAFETMSQVRAAFQHWQFLTREPDDDPVIVGVFL